MRVTLIKNYEEGDRVILKGQAITVTPWFFRVLAAGEYIKPAKVDIVETAMKNDKKEIRTKK